MVTQRRQPQSKKRAPSKKKAVRDRSVFARIADLGNGIPPEELDRMPRDGAMNHDHYIYGGPRKYCPECMQPYHDPSKCPALTSRPPAIEELVETAGLPAVDLERGQYPTVGEFAVAISRKLAPRESRQIPVDGADEHDHYIYGTPKQY